MSRFKKFLCACDLHAWGPVVPGSLHLKNGDYAMIGVTWAQIGSRKCTRPGCTAEDEVVREGEFGFDGLVIGNGQISQIDTTTGWGRSEMRPVDVLMLPPYYHSYAEEVLAVPKAA